LLLLASFSLNISVFHNILEKTIR